MPQLALSTVCAFGDHETPSRGEKSVLFGKLGVVVPPHTQIERDVSRKLPVVLSEQTVVGVSQVDRVAGGPQTLRHERRVHAGILEAVPLEVVDGRENQVEDLRPFCALDTSALTVPAELHDV